MHKTSQTNNQQLNRNHKGINPSIQREESTTTVVSTMVFSSRKQWESIGKVRMAGCGCCETVVQGGEYREWNTLHRDIIRCLARHVDIGQLPELRLLNKHWCISCDVLITKLSISNHAVSHFGSPSIPLDKVTKRFPTLQSLVVWKLNPDDAFMLSRLMELTLLDLGGTCIDDQSLRHISSLTKLTTLQLWETDVGDEGVEYLSGLSRLSSLSLRDSKVRDDGMASIAKLTNLTSLDLDRTQIGDTGAKQLVHLKKLQRLSLWYTPVGDIGASYLSNLTELTRLNLGFTRVTHSGLIYLSELTKLKSLELWGIQKPDNDASDEDDDLDA